MHATHNFVKARKRYRLSQATAWCPGTYVGFQTLYISRSTWTVNNLGVSIFKYPNMVSWFRAHSMAFLQCTPRGGCKSVSWCQRVAPSRNAMRWPWSTYRPHERELKTHKAAENLTHAVGIIILIMGSCATRIRTDYWDSILDCFVLAAAAQCRHRQQVPSGYRPMSTFRIGISDPR